MSFGTDLNFAYAGDLNSSQEQHIMEPVQKHNVNQNNHYNPSVQAEKKDVIPNNIQGLTMEQQLAVLKQELLKEKKKEKRDGASIISKFINKKRDMMKILIYSLIILLGLSAHFVIKHYLKLHLMENDFNSRKEFLLRFSYPLTVFAIIWMLKAFKAE